MTSPRSSLWHRLRPLLRPYHFETYTIAAAAASIVALRLWGLRLDFNTVSYTLGPFFRAAPRLLLLGLAGQLVLQLVRSLLQRDRAPFTRYVEAIRKPSWWFLWLRLFVAYGLVNYVYFWVKVSVPLINDRLWDGTLERIDRMLHLGLSPTILAVELFGGTPLVGVLDDWYGWWILTVMATITLFCAAGSGSLRRSFLLSCCLLWTIGPWLYVAAPSLGPGYAEAAVFDEVLNEIPKAAGGQLLLWENYQLVLAGRDGPLRSFNPTRGIAAMPSLHVAAHVLFALWAYRLARPLFVLFALGAGLTFAGSLVTGWHYAIDGYVGAALALASYYLALKLERPGLHPPEGDTTVDPAHNDEPPGRDDSTLLHDSTP